MTARRTVLVMLAFVAVVLALAGHAGWEAVDTLQSSVVVP